MKTCKIILVVLLAIRTIVSLIKEGLKDVNSEQKVINMLAVLVGSGISWGLYYGAGILDF